MFARVRGWSYAVGVGRKHVINWPELMLKAVSGQDGVFKSKAGGSIACNGKVLLRQLVRLENSWRKIMVMSKFHLGLEMSLHLLPIEVLSHSTLKGR
jgi:hypothetical protein